MDKVLINRIAELKNCYKPAEKFGLRVSYYPYKYINHTIRLRGGVIFVRLSDKIENAPYDIQVTAARLLFDKLFRLPTDKTIRSNYYNYIDQNVVPHIKLPKAKVSKSYISQGHFFDLETVFNKINYRYFDGFIRKPSFGWSQSNSTYRLAFYDRNRDLIVVSRIFDSRRTPNEVIEFLMYHEMLHIKIPVQTKNGRRIIHSKEFRTEEKKFQDYEAVQKWLKKRLWKLRF